LPGADGNLWFAEGAANRIGRISPTGGIVDYSIIDLRARQAADMHG